jgi:hypothetical protein
MGESVAELIAAKRALDRQGWARAEAARLPAAILDRAIAWQAARLRPPCCRGEAER